MGWESRKGTDAKYYTRSRREGGRVVREYFGCGAVAALVSQRDENDRLEREEARRASLEGEAKVRTQPLELSRLDQTLVKAISELMQLAGYHLHRGEWRKSRMNPTNQLSTEVVHQANQGDVGAMTLLQQELSGPNRGVLINRVGNLPRQVEHSALAMLANNQSGAKIIIQEKLVELRKELAATNVIEALIVERIALVYLQLHLAEMNLFQSNGENRVLQYRVESLNRSYLRALKTLANIRKKKITVSVEE